jgi:hypothetical protein
MNVRRCVRMSVRMNVRINVRINERRAFPNASISTQYTH